METKNLLNALIEVDDLIFKAHRMLSRFSNEMYFEGLKQRPAIRYTVKEKPHHNLDIEIFFSAELGGKTMVLGADDALLLMHNNGKIFPSDFVESNT